LRADYVIGNTHYWEPGFILNGDGSFTCDGDQQGESTLAPERWSATDTDDNHGDYVAESIDEHRPDAHSCIGMPIVGNGHSD
jgi:hypothetical protein